MSTVITVENLGKKFLLSHQTEPQRYIALRDVIADAARGLVTRLLHPFSSGKIKQHPNREEFWALKEVSFEVKQGERIGIIGRNGVGKSTLLKIISRITEPTAGEVRIRGRVASLLEVGTGFHPELTGRENIFLNGAILGMSRSEIKRKFDEIVDFAEIEKFLDTPVKRYSSGMYVRLAFAVAAHLEPEILVVDEVLAVGDAQFQNKCLGKMGEAGKDGRTIIFVSHNMTALQSLCNRAIWISAGRILKDAASSEVVSDYLQNGSLLKLGQVWENPEKAPGSTKIRLHSVKISYDGDEKGEAITVSIPINMEFQFWNFEADALLNFSVVLYNNQDVCIFNTGSTASVYSRGLVKGAFLIPGNFLNDAIYRVRLLIVKDMSIPLIDLENVATFEVHDTERQGKWYGKWEGAVRPHFQWITSHSDL